MIKFFKKLKEIIEKNEKVIIVGHKNPDLDCIAASIGLYKVINKECYVFRTTDKTNSTVTKTYQLLENENIKFINKDNYKEVISNNTLLIVLDLHRKQLIEHEPLLNEIKQIVLIDHHIIGNDKISPSLEYIDSKASSTTEIIAKYIINEGKNIDSVISTIMLSGIEIDTNGYNMKTTAETFKVAAWLMSMNADNILKQNILKENKEEYIRRTKQIENSYVINNNMMICVLDDDVYNPSYLALLSEDLLRFENVEASFTIGKITNEKIGISARSLGNINVEEIMSTLGGGGHLTDAACQFDSTSLTNVEKVLIKSLKNKGCEKNESDISKRCKRTR